MYWETKNICATHLFWCSLFVVVWNQTLSVSEVCLKCCHEHSRTKWLPNLDPNQQCVWEFQLLDILPSSSISTVVVFCNCSHSGGYVVVYNLSILTNWTWSSFLYVSWSRGFSVLWSVQVACPFLFRVVYFFYCFIGDFLILGNDSFASYRFCKYLLLCGVIFTFDADFWWLKFSISI